VGDDTLLLTGVSGREAVSELFRFQLDLLAENSTEVKFEDLLGEQVTATIEMHTTDKRYITGIVSRVAQRGRDQTFTGYRLEVVPKFWLLTRRKQSRIFQYMTVPDILKKVFSGLADGKLFIVDWELKGSYQPREYCVQYRESDFAFASRLMEEEGIYYFFKHTDSGHKMVVADLPASMPDLDPSEVIYEEIEGGNRPEDRIYQWERTQELRSGKVTLWDHCFEMPKQHLEADKQIPESVVAVTITHKLKTAGNEKLELYDFPGGYASRFDGIARGGGESPEGLTQISQDGKRVAGIRMQSEAAASVVIRGASSCAYFTPGFRAKLTRHFNADGVYALTSVEHRASLTGDYRTGGEANLEYENFFTCIPGAAPFRPPRITPIPQAQGAQTATVVGPSGEQIFTDKYGRIKVQFAWDREGKNDGNSSCWLRVVTPWAGKQWGMIHIPRVGQEVIVDFMDGDVNNPIVIGSVYNAEQMPPYTLPDNKTQSGILTRSTLSGSPSTCNEIRFEDKKGSELIFVHAEKDRTIEVEHDEKHSVDNDRTKTITNNETTVIQKGNRTETLEQGNEVLTIKLGNRTEEIQKGNDSLKISMGNRDTKIGMGNDTTKLDLGKSETEAMQSIELKVGQSSVKIDQMGVTIKGMMIKIEGQVKVDVKGLMTTVTADAMLTAKGAITMIN